MKRGFHLFALFFLMVGIIALIWDLFYHLQPLIKTKAQITAIRSAGSGGKANIKFCFQDSYNILRQTGNSWNIVYYEAKVGDSISIVYPRHDPENARISHYTSILYEYSIKGFFTILLSALLYIIPYYMPPKKRNETKKRRNDF